LRFRKQVEEAESSVYGVKKLAFRLTGLGADKFRQQEYTNFGRVPEESIIKDHVFLFGASAASLSICGWYLSKVLKLYFCGLWSSCMIIVFTSEGDIAFSVAGRRSG
jgi:cell shape-determining protein MreD